jgi:hypothetical protein
MQVDECRPAAGVAHAFHQLAEVRARVRGEHVPGMAQVVKMHRREPGRCQGTHPEPAPEVGVPERPASGAGEHESVITGPGMGDDVRGQVWCYPLGYRHDALTSLGFRRPEREPAAVSLVQLSGKPDGPGLGCRYRSGAAPPAHPSEGW